MKFFIRPVHKAETAMPVSIALCRTDGDILLDEDIVEHFPPDTSGKKIRECAHEFHRARCEWGKSINI